MDLMAMLAGSKHKVRKLKGPALQKEVMENVHNAYDNPDFIPDRGAGAGLAKAFAGKATSKPEMKRRISVREELWSNAYQQASNRLKRKQELEQQVKARLQRALVDKFKFTFTRPKQQPEPHAE